MKKVKKLFEILLCISLLLGALPMLAGAADAVKYTVKDGDCLYAIARTLLDIFCGFDGISKTVGAEYGAEGYFVDIVSF